ncbi:MAG: iduronate 2-sulfatase [Kiritimatiellia bacterium]|jgi:iduronate 2-sulfatase
MIAAPELASGRTRSLAELVDLNPTLCELANIPAPDHLQGESLVPILHKPEQSEPGIALSQYARYGTRYMGRAIRTDRYRFVTGTEQASGDVIERELYDHAQDPQEKRNLAKDATYEAHVTQLENQLRRSFKLE